MADNIACLYLELATGKKKAFYLLAPLEADPRVALKAWRLWRASDRVFYDVSINDKGWIECTCQDATYRQRMCKHAKALQALGLFELRDKSIEDTQ